MNRADGGADIVMKQTGIKEPQTEGERARMRVMIEGYLDGFGDDRIELPDCTNYSPAYVHGWYNGRDDRVGRPRASAELLRAVADRLIAEGRYDSAYQ